MKFHVDIASGHKEDEYDVEINSIEELKDFCDSWRGKKLTKYGEANECGCIVLAFYSWDDGKDENGNEKVKFDPHITIYDDYIE